MTGKPEASLLLFVWRAGEGIDGLIPDGVSGSHSRCLCLEVFRESCGPPLTIQDFLHLFEYGLLVSSKPSTCHASDPFLQTVFFI